MQFDQIIGRTHKVMSWQQTTNPAVKGGLYLCILQTYLLNQAKSHKKF